MTRSQAPSTASNQVNKRRLDLLDEYPRETLLLHLKDFDTSVLNISPLQNKYGIDDIVVWVNGITYDNISGIPADPTIDLTNTGIGGLVDGIPFVAANASDYLLWFFANDANTAVEGFAITHKPYSVYTLPASVAKGSFTLFTVTDAYQFTIGASVLVRNTVGASPLYEWNWGIIDDIASGTQLQIQMDNNANYGTALTGVTGGEILQWNMFRPWVVSGNGQSLYKNNYRLVGEIFTNSSGNIHSGYSVDDPFRIVDGSLVNETTGGTGDTAISSARYVPLWVDSIGVRVSVDENTTLPAAVNLKDPAGNVVIAVRAQVLGIQNNIYVSELGLTSYSRFNWGSSGTSTDKSITVRGYHVNGGMHL